MKYLAKKINDVDLDVRLLKDDDDRLQGLLDLGYKPLENEVDMDIPITGYQSLRNLWEDLGTHIRTYTVVVDNDPELISNKIALLKAQLTSSDYKVVKNYELQMAGEDPEYNPIELRAERQPLRDEINQLEALLP